MYPQLKALLQSERERANELQEKLLRVEGLDEPTVGTREAPIPIANADDIESLTTEINNLKILLESETERADAWEKKYLQSETSYIDKQIRSLEDEVKAATAKDAPMKSVDSTESLVAEVDELKAMLKLERECGKVGDREEQEALVGLKEELVQLIYSDKISSLATEIDELKTLLRSKRGHANERETKSLQAEGPSSEKCKKPTEEEEEILVAFKEDLVKVVYNDKFESLATELYELKASLQIEKDRAVEWQTKFLQVKASCNEKEEQLEEIQEGVQQIEETLESIATNLLHPFD